MLGLVRGRTGKSGSFSQLELLALVQGVSVLGASLTIYAIDIWVYENTQSYTIFATLALIGAIPAFLFSPFAGVLVDRCSKKRTLIVCNVICILALLALYLGVKNHMLNLIVIGVFTLIIAIVQTVHWPALSATVTFLGKDQDRIGKVNGILSTFNGVASVLGPIVGLVLLQLFFIDGILLFDVISLLLTTMVIVMIKFGGSDISKRSSPNDPLRKDLLIGVLWIRDNKKMLQLLSLFIVFNVAASIHAVVYTPYLLSFLNREGLSIALALSGSGLVVGGIAFSLFHQHFDKMTIVLAGLLSASILMIAWGMIRSPIIIYGVAFLYSFLIPLVNASSQTIWQSEVPLEIQGKVFSVRKMIAWGVGPFSILLSIPLANSVFLPLLLEGQPASSKALISVWGSGQTGSLGMMVSCFGAIVFIALIKKLRSKNLVARNTI